MQCRCCSRIRSFSHFNHLEATASHEYRRFKFFEPLELAHSGLRRERRDLDILVPAHGVADEKASCSKGDEVSKSPNRSLNSYKGYTTATLRRDIVIIVRIDLRSER